MVSILLISTILSASSVAITEPVDGETYNGNWLTVRAIVENENTLPDSVHYTLNGGDVISVPRLNTDWYTYMANDCHTGYSESPAPMDNTILWTAHVTGDSHEFPTPVVVDGIVYYPSNFGTDSLYALDAVSGEILWKTRVGHTDDAVTVKNGLLYIASDSLWCIDALTGEKLWASDEANVYGSTPVVCDGRVYAGTNQHGVGTRPDTIQVVCFNALTGSSVWNRRIILSTGQMVSCMTVWNDMLLVPTSGQPDDSGYFFALNRATGEVMWTLEDSCAGYWDSSPVLVDSTIYINRVNGEAVAIDAVSGTVIWEEEVCSYNLSITATPAYHDGRLYFGDQDDTYHCLDASTGTVVWSAPGFHHGSSGIAGEVIYYIEDRYPGNARVVALNSGTGSEIWSYTTGNPMGMSSPSIVDGVMYIAATDWNLYAFSTGLKYTYLDDLYAQVGTNELIVTSFTGGTAVAADTINFTVSGTGFTPGPSRVFSLTAGPNPFAVSADISFELPNSGYTSVSIFDLAGREVATLLDKETVQGAHSVSWNGSMQSGEEAPSGLYLVRIESGGVVETTGLCLLR